MALQLTPLDALHRELDARMVPFAGYDMPVQYPTGIIKEHLHTREAAGLFDVSHMGQLIIEGKGAASMLESVLPVDIQSLGINRQTYAVMTNDTGGILDDLIVTRWSDERFFLVVNAACKAADIEHLQRHLGELSLLEMKQQALLAVQGPAARSVVSSLFPDVAVMPFMHGCSTRYDGVDVYITCSGYTGEDGFELSVPASHAEPLARQLLADKALAPIGLGARDSLRLEAGLCLYGHELGPEIGPVEAGLTWSISKARRADGERPGGFPGADAVLASIETLPARRRVGLRVQGKRPLREGQSVLDGGGNEIGTVSSAAFGASAGGPIAMAFIARSQADAGTQLTVSVRDKQIPVEVVPMPFVPQRYFRG